MRLSDTLFQCFNRQLNAETGNYAVYANLSYLAGNQSWSGFESFFQEYALDEITHAQKIADFIIGRNKTPYVDTLPRPQIGNPQTPADWVNVAYEKAKEYTALIKQNYQECIKEGDYAAVEFERWYIKEQDRVEAYLFDLWQECSRAGSNAGLLLIDKRYRKKE